MSSIKKRSDLIDSVDYFMKNNSPFASALSFSRRCRFVILDHCSNYNDDIDEFVLKIYYDTVPYSMILFLIV